jgi:uncharacterized protein YndB with AHSA1/START domain
MIDASATGELTFTCILDAPRELVFRCMIEPEHLTHFWGPVGVTTPLDSITVDPRPGGAFETTMVNDADGSEHRMRSVYVEVVEPEKLVWIEPDHDMTTTSLFIDLGDGRTEVRIHQTNVPAMFVNEEAQKGFESSLTRFNAYVASLSA